MEKTAKKVKSRVIMKINCPSAGLNDTREIHKWKSLKMHKTGDPDIYDAFRKDKRNIELSNEWEHYWEVSFKGIEEGLPPTFNTTQFNVDYFLQVRFE